MKVIEHLERLTNPVVSVEIIPPRRGGNISQIYQAIESIKQFHPPYINVTSHAAEIFWEPMPDGTYKKRVKRKSPGTFGLCAAIKYKFNIDPVPHILCAGFTREETEDALIELNYLGIENLLAIRGDSKFQKPVSPEKKINNYSLDLVSQISRLNQGIYQDDLIDASPMDFCIGVACYPEKHMESPNLRFDLQILRRKQDSGAHYAISQMFFDNQAWYAFKEKLPEFGIRIPVIPGLKILTSKAQLSNIPRAFNVDIPDEITDRIMSAKTNDEVLEEGVSWAAEQALDLFDKGEKNVHFYIMQNTRPFVMLMDKLRKHL